MVINVGIGDYAISHRPGDKIVTYALASCVAVTAYSPSKKVSGMIHILLPGSPQSRCDDYNARCYADTGIPLMINRMCSEYGCTKSELEVRLFGGASSVRADDVFKLGQKNILMAEKVLKDLELSYDASETGGVLSRTLVMDSATGKVTVKLRPIII